MRTANGDLVVKLRAERWTMADKRGAVDQEAINEADAIRAVLEGTAYSAPPEGAYTVCPKCGSHVVQLQDKHDIIVECAAGGCDWWDVQPDAKRAKRVARERERLAAARMAEVVEQERLARVKAEDLLENARCEICGGIQHRVRFGIRQSLAQDHCHKTGRLRGLLCSRCNMGLGSFQDDPALLVTAVEYLKKYSSG
jgi:hypothetical protein